MISPPAAAILVAAAAAAVGMAVTGMAAGIERYFLSSSWVKPGMTMHEVLLPRQINMI
jgi:hypothetical protein